MKKWFFMLLLIQICCKAASNTKTSTSYDESSCHAKNDSENILLGASSNFEVEIPKYNWYGRKQRFRKAAVLMICLKLQDAKKGDDARMTVQQEFIKFIEQELIGTKNICPVHMQKLLANILLKGVQHDSVTRYGEPQSCNFCLKIGDTSWNGSAKFEQKTCYLHCIKEKIK